MPGPPEIAAPNHGEKPFTVALTGATGFIGAAVARTCAARGWRIRALFRPASAAKVKNGPPAQLPVEWVEGALEDWRSLAELLAGADGVVHCAGAVRGARWRDFERANVTGTWHLARLAASRDMPPRFLYISSLAAREPQLSYYALSKRRGERALADAAGGMAWAALRPPPVYGPGDREMRPLFAWLGRGVAPLLGGPGARLSLVFAPDLAEAAAAWLASGDAGKRACEVHDGRENGYGWEDIVAIAQGLTGRRVLRLRVPDALLATLAAGNGALARVAGYAPMLTPGKVRELRHPNWVCDNTVLTKATGWRPRFSLEQGLRQTMGWG
jgi:nucleoside-diphosphate-sugar epimerase